MTAVETLELLSKQWCSITDLTNQGYKLPCNLIPMCEVVNKLNINVPYLKDMAEPEK